MLNNYKYILKYFFLSNFECKLVNFYLFQVQDNDSMEKNQNMKTPELTPKTNKTDDTTIEVSTQVPTVTELW